MTDWTERTWADRQVRSNKIYHGSPWAPRRSGSAQRRDASGGDRTPEVVGALGERESQGGRHTAASTRHTGSSRLISACWEPGRSGASCVFPRTCAVRCRPLLSSRLVGLAGLQHVGLREDRRHLCLSGGRQGGPGLPLADGARPPAGVARGWAVATQGACTGRYLARAV